MGRNRGLSPVVFAVFPIVCGAFGDFAVLPAKN